MKSIISDGDIRNFSTQKRVLLLSHIDRAVEINVGDTPTGQTRNSLLTLGLLRVEPRDAVRPRYTVLTPIGRHAVGVILGDYADALVAAGLLVLDQASENERPIDALRRIKETASQALPPLVAPGQTRGAPTVRLAQRGY
jgi:hypothetical protein